MKLDQNKLRKLILQEMKTLSEGMHDAYTYGSPRSYSDEERDGYAGYRQGLIDSLADVDKQIELLLSLPENAQLASLFQKQKELQQELEES